MLRAQTADLNAESIVEMRKQTQRFRNVARLESLHMEEARSLAPIPVALIALVCSAIDAVSFSFILFKSELASESERS